jgi:hypothetical protein
MIENFAETKEQLRELAEIIKLFTSEAVQLRLIDLVFGANATTIKGDTSNSDQAADKGGKNNRRKPRPPLAKASNAIESTAGKSKPPRRLSGSGLFTRLLDEGFFDQPKTIKQLVEHCDQNLATKRPQSAFSGSLARLTRERKLKRTKNSDNQYEYTKA